jgi:hypothetical protein
MKPLTSNSIKGTGPYRWMPLLIIFLLTLFVLLIIRQYPSTKNFSVVHINGKGAATNLSKAYRFTYFGPGQKYRGALLAEKNDLLGFNDSYFYFTGLSADSLKVDDSGDSILQINGKINALIVNADEDLLPWFIRMNPEQLDDLKTLVINAPLPDSYIPHLQEIALQHPNLSLVFTPNDSTDLAATYREKTDFFQPLFVSLQVTDKQIPGLAHWNKAECLYINLADSLITQPLPALPAMKECIVIGENATYLPVDFFTHNPQLENLSLLIDAPYGQLLSPLKKLDELVLMNEDSIPSLPSLSDQLDQLSVLIISGNCKNIDQLDKATRLNWLGLPQNTSQQEFNRLCSKLKKLQVLELTGNKTVTDYSALKELTDLSGLVIRDTVTDKTHISNLKKLRYLSLPQENKADSAFIKEMEKALPGCIIVANSGACLGSGWLLFLLPVVLLSGFIFYKKQQA